jgi:hypothetical protein
MSGTASVEDSAFGRLNNAELAIARQDMSDHLLVAILEDMEWEDNARHQDQP